MNLLGHKCGESGLTCTKCSKPVCRQCMQVAPTGVSCTKCMPNTWKATIVPAGMQSMMRLQAASVMLSLMFAKLLSIITPCIG
jgi:hypothetical protein